MRLGSAVFVLAFAVLALLCAPGLYLGDSGELTTAAFGLGVAHETGFPLFCLAGKLLALVPLGEVALRLDLLSALSGAAAAALAWAIVRDFDGEPTAASTVSG